MIRIRRSKERGHADHGWLDTYHTFSFASYYDPEHTQFRTLRVINEDRVQPGRGFPTHGHENMEIITYVIEGRLAHEDSMGSSSEIGPGEIQMMSAGTGVTHSEFNASKEAPLHFLQIWILPEKNGTEPRYRQKLFPAEERRGRMHLVVSPDGRDGSLAIGQDALMYAGLIDSGGSLDHELGPGRYAWLQVVRGNVKLNRTELRPGDGAALEAEPMLEIRADDDSELVLFDLG